MLTLKLLTPPSQPAVALVDAKAHMRVDITDDDALITALVAAAQEHIEDVTGVRMVTQQWRLYQDRFSRVEATYVFFNRLVVPSIFDIAANHLMRDQTRTIRLPLAPLVSVDAFNVFDTNGVEAAFSSVDWLADVVSIPGRIVLKESQDWPYPAADLQEANAVQIDFTVGYGLPAAVPNRLLLAIKMLAAHWYDNRADSAAIRLEKIPMAVDQLIDNFRVWDREDRPQG